jgi:hypothetical protein
VDNPATLSGVCRASGRFTARNADLPLSMGGTQRLPGLKSRFLRLSAGRAGLQFSNPSDMPRYGVSSTKMPVQIGRSVRPPRRSGVTGVLEAGHQMNGFPPVTAMVVPEV